MPRSHRAVLISGQGQCTHTPETLPQPIKSKCSCSTAAQQDGQCYPHLCAQGCSWCMPAVWCSSHGMLSIGSSSFSPLHTVLPDYPPNAANLPAELVPPMSASAEHMGIRSPLSSNSSSSSSISSSSASQGWAHSLVCVSTPEAPRVWGSGCTAHGQLGEFLQHHKEEPAPALHGTQVCPQCPTSGEHISEQDKAGQQHEGSTSGRDGSGEKLVRAWVPINLPSRMPVRMVAAGHFHSLFLSASGAIWSLGGNKHGQLGVGHTQNCRKAQLVSGDHHVTQIACGALHSLAVTAEGALLSWGWAGLGALGHGCIMDETVPRLVQALLGLRMAQATGGGAHSLALSADGDVYSFGSNTQGQLGLGHCSSVCSNPQLVEAITDTIVQVSAGSRHSLALTEQGRPLAWGFNGFGQLGSGDTEDRLMPCAMCLSEAGDENKHGKVVEVAAGWWHSLLLIES
ncbi:regulator of chromosome condensation 1/beta-lactamase-inhibitor protein II [Dunaliella salina]|uniref:Regulator of chromosome condensation 1/beta-lactamase-inhibitor protein II n=1 Tax=Dunaliella salina TaxID=3046 RepID=A0ABQ7H5P4_DUNSA|nr:regulator of chromosome condensation 1/beta-lactamase-inhibitor protein II [Dunaliella salina]|eukprot:KAF5842172.1 regulator of chromosome condensation 1/beta-lactamase-inhibitor protein II [Dunaliella salina]